jgi:putative tryptophan/tyrosine transport system substrate-binding protein
MRRVAYLSVLRANAENGSQLFSNELAKLGWVEGRNLQLDIRHGAGDLDRIRIYAAELVNLRPDVIVALGAVPRRAVQERTQTIPIVIIGGGDVYASGVVTNLAHPDGNITGIVNLFASIGGKWMEFLKGAVPQIERVAFVASQSAPLYFASITETARVMGVEASEIRYRNVVDLVQAIDAFAAAPNGALIIGPVTEFNQETIFHLAAQHHLPTVGLAEQGALLDYGPTADELFRRECLLR